MCLRSISWSYPAQHGSASYLHINLQRIQEAIFITELWPEWTADQQMYDWSHRSEVKVLCLGLRTVGAHAHLIKHTSIKMLYEKMNLSICLGTTRLLCHIPAFGLIAGTVANQPILRIGNENNNRPGYDLRTTSNRSMRPPLGNRTVYLPSRVLACIAGHSTFGHLKKRIDTTYTNIHSQLYKSQVPEFVHFFQYYLIHLLLRESQAREKEHLASGRGMLDREEGFQDLTEHGYSEQIVFTLIQYDPKLSALQMKKIVQDHIRRPMS
jgi:hypothetical protein